MRIERLEINGFGRIRDLVIVPGRGLNVIYGANEAGKSTVQRFIRAMLYGAKSGRETLRRFMPWDGGPYGGVMVYSLDDGSQFRVERNFERNTVRIFDTDYNDISGTFRIGRDKLPMFADEHLGMDEATFIRTAFIGQMDVRVGSSGSAELAARLANVNETGAEALSFRRAEEALANALKNRIGTERTRTQPLDKLEAGLKQLRDEHARLMQKQELRQRMKEELAEVKERRTCLEERERYLLKVGELVDARKKIDAGIKKETVLRETATLLEEADRKLSELTEREGTAQGNMTPDGGTGLVYGYGNAEVTGSRGSGRRKGDAFRAAVVFVCFAAALVSAALLVPALLPGDGQGLPVTSLAYVFILIVSVTAGSYFLGKRSRDADSLAGDIPAGMQGEGLGPGIMANVTGTGTETANTGGDLVKEKIDSLEMLKRNALNNAFLICGRRMEDIGDVRDALEKIRSELEELSDGLQRSIEGLGAPERQGSGFFDGKDLDMVIYDTDIPSLEAALKSETANVRDELLKTALREKYCEGMAGDESEDSYELQRVEEETVAVKEKIAYLKSKADAIRLALEVLKEAGAEIRRDFTPGLNRRMSSIIEGMTGRRYTDLRGDESLLLKAVVPEYKEVRDALLLSGGTADQMYLAMRLAMTGLLTSGAESLPLIMDEVFSQFDDNRTSLALKYLHDEYEDAQIFIFTCKMREAELAGQIFGDSMYFVELGHEDQ